MCPALLEDESDPVLTRAPLVLRSSHVVGLAVPPAIMTLPVENLTPQCPVRATERLPVLTRAPLLLRISHELLTPAGPAPPCHELIISPGLDRDGQEDEQKTDDELLTNHKPPPWFRMAGQYVLHTGEARHIVASQTRCICPYTDGRQSCSPLCTEGPLDE